VNIIKEDSVNRTKNIIISAVAALFFFSACAGVISVRNPKMPKTETAAVERQDLPPVLFEDFESGTLHGSYSYANRVGGASAAYSISVPGTDTARAGEYSAKAVVNTGTDSDWGCGFGASPEAGFVDASGRDAVSLWVNAPPGKTFYVFVNEAGANDADGEFWNSPDQTGTGDWNEYIIPLDEFFRNIYSGNQEGNLNFDTSGIGTVGLQFGGNQGRFEVFVDDIYFIMMKK